MEINDLQDGQLDELARRIATRMRPPAPAADNPGVERGRRERKKSRPIQYLTEDEIRALFGQIKSPRDVALFTVAYHRGLRASEAGLLQLGQLRLAQRRLYVTRLKGGRSADFPLTDREVKALRAWLRVRGDQPGPLFLSRNRKRISRSRLDQLMKRYAAAAGLPAAKQHFHCLRHSCATSLVERDVDLLLIQDHLGHQDIRNTERYAKVSERKRREMGERLRQW